ncbi:MAG: hypothetical protein KDK76_07040 [Chlamydiia bacterium]|nr:hypothetical protein [Chlamydiia bacterium]
MDQEAYHQLIDDTLTYLRSLQPKPLKEKEEIKIDLPPPPSPPKVKTSPPPKAEPLPQKEEKERPQKIFIELTPPPIPPLEPRNEMKKLLKELAPDLYLHETIPSDAKAKRIKDAWKEKREVPDIPILVQGNEYRSFMANLAKAIDTVYGSARIIEVTQDKKWDLFLESKNLKLIIAPDSVIFGSKYLLPFYQENPQQKTRKLGNVPLLLLPDLSLYFKDSYLKRALWNVIQNSL